MPNVRRCPIIVTHAEYTDNLLREIENKKENMVKTAQTFGLTGEETLKYSRELDELITKYQYIQRKEKQTSS
ncbi:Spo0E family sporulation regulatory protein-aspartic acid phosphatase [Virgibacillus sp. JSM 102003]|uniref:Spo0E family sporulation regulatory protein-aspartic acid phosphatase n=1 Tax=Virgibacillus sp. JSM 102003 TaxID=1562108 RepID=UPI0035C2310F